MDSVQTHGLTRRVVVCVVTAALCTVGTVIGAAALPAPAATSHRAAVVVEADGRLLDDLPLFELLVADAATRLDEVLTSGDHTETETVTQPEVAAETEPEAATTETETVAEAQDAAETERQKRAEKRISRHAGYNFDAAANHRLHQDPPKRLTGSVLGPARREPPRSAL